MLLPVSLCTCLLCLVHFSRWGSSEPPPLSLPQTQSPPHLLRQQWTNICRCYCTETTDWLWPHLLFFMSTDCGVLILLHRVMAGPEPKEDHSASARWTAGLNAAEESAPNPACTGSSQLPRVCLRLSTHLWSHSSDDPEWGHWAW